MMNGHVKINLLTLMMIGTLMAISLAPASALTFSGNNDVTDDSRDQNRFDMAVWRSETNTEVYTAYEDLSFGPSTPHIFFRSSIIRPGEHDIEFEVI